MTNLRNEVFEGRGQSVLDAFVGRPTEELTFQEADAVCYAFISLGLNYQAVDFAQRRVEATNRDEDRLQLAWALKASSSFREAEALLEVICDPSLIGQTKALKAVLRADLGDCENAMRMALGVRRSVDNNLSLYVQLSVSNACRDIEALSEVILEILETKDIDSALLTAACYGALHTKDFELVRRALALIPRGNRSPEVLCVRLHAAMKDRKYGEADIAAGLLSECLEDGSFLVAFHLGYYHMRFLRYKRAEGFLRTALEKTNDRGPVLQLLAEVLMMRGKLREAASLAREATTLGQRSRRLRRTFVFSCTLSGRWRTAWRALQKW